MNAARSEGGFSLIELLVAMLVTMMISGAVFTLLSAGQGAFRRQPEMTERQQNIRLAMDFIQRDIATAGAGLDPFEQAFSAGDGVGDTAPLLDGLGPLGASGRNSDVLEILGADGTCNDVPTDLALPPPAGSTTVNTAFGVPECFANAQLGAIVSPDADTAWWGIKGVNVPGDTVITFPAPPGAQPPKSDITAKNGIPPGPTRLVAVQLVRYAIQVDPASQVPNLWRSGQGGLNAVGVLTPVGDATGGWQLIARGIEDLQVRYRQAGAAPLPAPPAGAACCGSPLPAVNPNWNTLVKEVEVTLWARTLAPNLQGQTTSPAGVIAIHGSLTTVTSPRAVLQALHGAPPGQFHWQ